MKSYQGKSPNVHPSVFVAEGAQVIGDVTIGANASVWFNAVLRGDLAPIVIGERTNIQDGCIGHVNQNMPLMLQSDISVGHGAIIHGCVVGKGTLIGMGSIILNEAEIGEYALIGAGSLVTERMKIPPYTLAFGSPAKVIRELNEQDLLRMQKTTSSYVQKSMEFARSI